MSHHLPTPTPGGRPAWHYAAGIGSTWHGLELLGARDPYELERMGFDVVYFDGAPPGAEPVVDVYRARVVFPISARLNLTKTATMPPLSELRPLSDLAWPFTWSMFLADARRQGLIEVRRLANRSRARLGLLSSDDEENIERIGGRVHGATGYDRLGRPVAVGAAAHREVVSGLTAGRHAYQGVSAGELRFKGKA